ncbi:radical SAM family heme chaperone HemW [Sedimentitalea nanhaiensis]|uniref:Heme chaperone HemW n=1 Tax=Sedimentitalea nanhaiensis TaxID=999627 RepID=A0A1I7DQ94_9RHOB|nr:radical SAM family heme chaperone HemW [Sedimentitalea nanhaiensis]SFU13806.1 oxygen-independent coproporphyrinogen-3 oxidase [Sedimentitalea nanhaiensis]
MVEDWQQGGFGLYVHWPFCQAKCPYCDFNSHVSRQIDHSEWMAAYLSELNRVAAQTPNRVLRSIFFGGGTPSLMEPDTVAAIIQAAGKHWTFGNDIEITLEANPGSVEAGRFSGFRDAGINRISMGVQALNDTDLRRLGRIHSVAEARTAFDIARACFNRVSFDLIYARQDQTLDQWRSELTEALSMTLDHLSLYQLTIESGTAFGDRFAAGTLRGLPGDDLSADMYEVTQELCDLHGLPMYEVSNHARPGAESRHNLIYWQGGDYAGIGPGAHGRLTLDGSRYATECYRGPQDWLKAVATGNGDCLRQPLSGLERAEEYLMMGLRLTSGIDVKRYEDLSGRKLNMATRKSLVDLGMISDFGDRIIVKKQGFMILNAITSEFLTD